MEFITLSHEGKEIGIPEWNASAIFDAQQSPFTAIGHLIWSGSYDNLFDTTIVVNRYKMEGTDALHSDATRFILMDVSEQVVPLGQLGPHFKQFIPNCLIFNKLDSSNIHILNTLISECGYSANNIQGMTFMPKLIESETIRTAKRELFTYRIGRCQKDPSMDLSEALAKSLPAEEQPSDPSPEELKAHVTKMQNMASSIIEAIDKKKAEEAKEKIDV